MNTLFIVEGADGTGKTTLCNAILEETKGHLLHASYDKNWDIKYYHQQMYDSAFWMLGYQPVVFDRWAVSEEVYANAYRGGSTYSADGFMDIHINGILYSIGYENVKFVYCTNENAVENHNNNKRVRDELYEDVSPVVREYEKYMTKTKLDWIKYDFNKVNMKDFVKEITK